MSGAVQLCRGVKLALSDTHCSVCLISAPPHHHLFLFFSLCWVQNVQRLECFFFQREHTCFPAAHSTSWHSSSSATPLYLLNRTSLSLARSPAPFVDHLPDTSLLFPTLLPPSLRLSPSFSASTRYWHAVTDHMTQYARRCRRVTSSVVRCLSIPVLLSFLSLPRVCVCARARV